MKKMFIDDNVTIPDEIKKMSEEELDAEISKFEADMKQKKLKSEDIKIA